MTTLTGQGAIVTGAGRGIGRTIARTLAAAGARVVVTARSAGQLSETVALITAAGGEAFAELADVADCVSVTRMVKAAEEKLGGVDLLVNNAGIMGPMAPIWEVDPGEWASVVQTNLIGTFHCSRAVLPAMIAARRGRIINIMGGRVGMQAGPYVTAYQASKAGVVWFTEDLSKETAEYGITVFSLQPGGVATDMSAAVARSPWMQKFFGAGEAAVAAGFRVPPERAGELCVLLASGAADRLSGRTFSATLDDAQSIADADGIVQRDARTLRFRP